MNETDQDMIGYVAGGIILIGIVFGSFYLDYQWKKAIVRDAIYEAEQAKAKDRNP